jgi:TatD DNase family protein
MELIDTHAHLQADAFDGDRAETLERARQAGVTRVVAIGADLASSKAALALADGNPSIIATVGVHPHDARNFTQDQWDELVEMVGDDRARAIGEIGLDYHYDFSPREAQQFAFQSQLSLAATFGLPVVVHEREAFDDMLATLKVAFREGPPSEDGGVGHIGHVVMHCFLGDTEQARVWLDLGCHIGIGGAVTFKKMEALREAAAFIPLDRLLLETDCPYMAPHPHRGQRNEPAHTALVAQTVAEMKGLKLDDVARATTDNAFRVFGAW